MRIARNVIVFIMVLAVFAGLLASRNLSPGKAHTVDLRALVEQVNQNQVKSIEISGDELVVALADGTAERAVKEPNESFTDLMKNYGIPPEKLLAVNVSVKEASGLSAFLGSFLPFILPFVVLAALFMLLMRQVQGANSRAMSFGQSGAREIPKATKDRVTFKEVAGVREAKEELLEVVEFLRNPKKFSQIGAKIPKGVLLMGPPGTGKTLLARAVAGEADVPFFTISGSEFVEMFVGVGAARVRDLFARAKKSAPCIMFIDEIDAVGRQRGAGLGGSHDEREQTLNQILVEMDGFDPNLGVIVIAGTNRPDILDPALLRPGRFDRRVVLDLPDINDREAILKIHTKGKPLASDVNLRKIAERTPGFSGADLANVLNEAAILAARQNKKIVGMEDLIPAVEKVLLGPERKSHILSEEERRITAFHEAGHALVAHELPYADPVHKVSIIARGQAAGYTLKLPTEDRHLRKRQEFIDDLAVSLGGFVAEREIFGDITTGASNDLKTATRLARSLITQYGMSDRLGPRTFGERDELIFLGREIHEQRDYSEKIAEQIDEEVTRLINQAMKTAEHIVRSRRDRLDAIVEHLLEKEIIEQDAFEALFDTHPHRRHAPKKPVLVAAEPRRNAAARTHGLALKPKSAEA